MVSRNDIPTPEQRMAPTQAVAAGWFNLPANESVNELDIRHFGNQAIDVRKVGGDPLNDVAIQVETTRRTNNGEKTTTDTFDSSAFNNFGNPSESGPFATERLVFGARNGTATNYTQSGSGAYRAFFNYVVRRMSVIEKLRRNVPLSESGQGLDERDIAEEYGLLEREDRAQPQAIPSYLQPSVNDKVIRERESVVETFDVNGTGSRNGETFAKESALRDRNSVVYVTGIEVNSQNYASQDNLKIRFTRSKTDNFYDLHTYGLPGFSNDYYKADLFLPFTDSMAVTAWLDNDASRLVSNVDVNLEYVVVERTLLEKALYGLRSEAQDERLYETVREQIRAGVPLAGELRGE